MNHGIRMVLLLALLVLIRTKNGAAADFFVAMDGDDANSGTATQPWRTIQKAADTLAPGDTAYIKAGIYYEWITVTRSGEPNLPITFAAYNGDRVILDGQNLWPDFPGPDAGLFQINGQHDVIVRGLRVINSNGAGLFVQEGAMRVLLENNSTSNTWSSGIGVWNCTSISLIGNAVQGACQGDGQVQECFTVSRTNDFEVRNNEICNTYVDYGGEGLSAKESCRNGRIIGNHVHDLTQLGIYIDAQDSVEQGIEVAGNLVHDTQNDGINLSVELSSGSLQDVVVCNNIVYNIRYHGIVISDNRGSDVLPGDGPKRNIMIINNTVFHNGYNEANWGGGISITTTNPLSGNLVVRNNICSDNNQWQILHHRSIGERITVDYNLIDGPNEYADEDTVSTEGLNSIAAMPRFVNGAGHDFRLFPNSPAIDAGSPLGAPLMDYSGIARPQDGNGDGAADFDIGAYEHKWIRAIPAKIWIAY